RTRTRTPRRESIRAAPSPPIPPPAMITCSVDTWPPPRSGQQPRSSPVTQALTIAEDSKDDVPENAKALYSFSVQRNNDPYRIEAVDRALTLVTLLAERGSLSVTEAGRELGVAPSTAHRLLSTLCHRQCAVQGDKRLYRPGPALLALAKAGGPPLADRIRPYLQRLYDLVGETVHLMVRTGAEIRVVDGIESRHPLRVGLGTGARMPAYCTSGGKAMLADLEPSEIDALHAGGLPPWPGEKIHNLSALHETLEAVRRNRLGVNHEESEPGVTAIGQPIGRVVTRADRRPARRPHDCPAHAAAAHRRPRDRTDPPVAGVRRRPTGLRGQPRHENSALGDASPETGRARHLNPKAASRTGNDFPETISRTPNSRSRSHHDVIV